MMSLVRLGIPIFLAAAAAVLGLAPTPATSRLERTLWEQGGLRPLVLAEGCLAREENSVALTAWQTCTMRAHREHQLVLYEAVRHRMGLAGKQAWPSQPSAWQFLSRYVLYSDRFSANADLVESYVLSSPRPTPRFEYALTEDGGERTIWQEEPAVSALWLYRHLPATIPLSRVPGFLYNIKPSDLPPDPDWANVYLVALSNMAPVPRAVLIVRSGSSATAHWYLSYHNLVQWDRPLVAGSEGGFTAEVKCNGLLNIDRIICMSQHPQLQTSLTLAREYERLSLQEH